MPAGTPSVVEPAGSRVLAVTDLKPLPDTKVCVTIVTYNSARYIRPCLEAVLRQEGAALDVVVVDNASTDGTRDILSGFGRRIRVIANARNLGFAAAQNQAIRTGIGDWVLTLNPDALLQPDFVRALVAAGSLDPGAGSICGKLVSIGPGFQPLPEPYLDSTGIYFTPAMRHFDRGWREPDNGHYQRLEYVFGACAAAALYRREMIEDVSIDGDFFDPDFFAYREDADVAWRAQLLGWRCIYTPAARAWHVRGVKPGDRGAVPPAVNMHSVKNRFLMRIKNATAGVYRRYWAPMTVRDLLVVGGIVLTEPRSLAALWHTARCLRGALRRRRWIMARRRVSDVALSEWFSFDPVARAVGQGGGLSKPGRSPVPRRGEVADSTAWV
jgi:GT2 family glycosyltransferase